MILPPAARVYRQHLFFLFKKTDVRARYLLVSYLHKPLLITDYWLLITDYWLPTTDYRLLITDYRLLITDYWLPITDYWLPITDYRLLITDYSLVSGLIYHIFNWLGSPDISFCNSIFVNNSFISKYTKAQLKFSL